MNSKRPPAQLEQLFTNRNTPKILDHLILTRGLGGFTLTELGKIHDMHPQTVKKSIDILKDNGLVEILDDRASFAKYQFVENDTNLHLQRFLFELAIKKMDA